MKTVRYSFRKRSTTSGVYFFITMTSLADLPRNRRRTHDSITESDYYPQPQDKVAIVCGLNYSCRLFVLLGETIARLHVDKRSPPHGPFATVRLEEVRSLHARVMDALVHAPDLFQLKRPMALGVMVDRGQEIRMDGTRFRQITLDEIKNSFDDSKSPNALDPFLIMQANLYVTRVSVRVFGRSPLSGWERA